MAEIRAILFDVGGVLLTNGWDHEERAAVLEHFSVDRAAYEARHELANDAWEKGFMTVEQFLQRTVFFEPRSFTPTEFLEEIKARSKILGSGILGSGTLGPGGLGPGIGSGAAGLLGELRAVAGLRLAVLNNEARELNDFRIERFELHKYFDVFLSSCYLGLRKPDPKMFRLALDVLKRKPEEVIFVDDRQENCDAAASLGIQAICYQEKARFTRELERLDVL